MSTLGNTSISPPAPLPCDFTTLEPYVALCEAIEMMEASEKQPANGPRVGKDGVTRYYKDGVQIPNPNAEGAVKAPTSTKEKYVATKGIAGKDLSALSKEERELLAKGQIPASMQEPGKAVIEPRVVEKLAKDLGVDLIVPKDLPPEQIDEWKSKQIKDAARERENDAWKETHLPGDYHKKMAQVQQWDKEGVVERLTAYRLEREAKDREYKNAEERKKHEKLVSEKVSEFKDGNPDVDYKDPVWREAISLWSQQKKEAEQKASESEKVAADVKTAQMFGATAEKPKVLYHNGKWELLLGDGSGSRLIRISPTWWQVYDPRNRHQTNRRASRIEAQQFEEVLQSLNKESGWQRNALDVEESRRNIILSTDIAKDYNYRLQRYGGVKGQTAKATSNLLAAVDLITSGTLRRMGVGSAKIPWASILYAVGSNYKEPRKMVEAAADMVVDNSEHILKFADEEQRKGEISWIRQQQEKEEITKYGKALESWQRIMEHGGFHVGTPHYTADSMHDGMRHDEGEAFKKKQIRKAELYAFKREQALLRAARGPSRKTDIPDFGESIQEAEDWVALAGLVDLMEDEQFIEANIISPLPFSTWGRIITKEAPHTRIVGPTQSGKSVLAQAIAHDLEGHLLIIDPVWRPKNWGGLPVVTVTEDGQFTEIEKALRWILDEMKRRGAALQKGESNFPRLNIIWDEVPDTVAELSLAGEVIRRIAQRGRHSNIHLIGIGQSERVGSWGLEGFGDAAENFCSVYLGSKAVAHIPELAGYPHVGSIAWQGKQYPINLTSILGLSKQPLSTDKATRLPDVQMVEATNEEEEPTETPIEFDEKEELIKKLLSSMEEKEDKNFFGLLVVQCYVMTRNLSSAIDAANYIWDKQQGNETEESLTSYAEDLGEDQAHKEGEPWEGKSGRWFVMKGGRPVPAKNPKTTKETPRKEESKPTSQPKQPTIPLPSKVAKSEKAPKTQQTVKRKDAKTENELLAQGALEKFEAKKLEAEGKQPTETPPTIPHTLRKEGVRVYIVNSRFRNLPFLPRFGPLHHRGVFFCPPGQQLSINGTTNPKCHGWGTRPGSEVFQPEGQRIDITYREVKAPVARVAERIEAWQRKWTLLHNCQTAANAAVNCHQAAKMVTKEAVEEDDFQLSLMTDLMEGKLQLVDEGEHEDGDVWKSENFNKWLTLTGEELVEL